MKLVEIIGDFSILRLAPTAEIPAWACKGQFCSVVKTVEELSIVCETRVVASGFEKREDDWKCLKVAGPLDFGLTGILASISTPLAQAGISIFAISTFDTDYILVKDNKFEAAKDVLKSTGFEIN